MTNEEIFEASEVMRRAANGEPLQGRQKRTGPDAWWNVTFLENLVWDFESCAYRIKPEQDRVREVWIDVSKHGEECLGECERLTAHTRQPDAKYFVRFREVIE